jgi:hypothetical protein
LAPFFFLSVAFFCLICGFFYTGIFVFLCLSDQLVVGIDDGALICTIAWQHQPAPR